MGGSDAATAATDKDSEVRDGGMEAEDDGGEERASKRVRREEGSEQEEQNETQPVQKVPNGANGGKEGDTRDELAMEDEPDLQDDDSVEDEDEEDRDEDVSNEEEDEDEDAGSASGPDMESRLRAIQDGLSSGVDDDGSGDESD